MGYYAKCGACKGSGNYYTPSGKRLDCKACGGTGSNKNLYETQCQYCRKSFVHKIDQPQKYCRDCRNIEKEKRCAQYGCDQIIRYKLSWDRVSDYCRHCEFNRKKGYTASSCSNCRKLVWSPPGKSFNLCRECGEKERATKEAKWKTKSCKGCKREIRYNEDWSKIPDYCPDCVAWKKKPCSNSNCTNTVQYKVFWDNIPNFCDDCRKNRRSSGEGKHSHAYKKARKEFMRNSLNDPTVPSRIKEWISQEIKTRGEDGYWRSPPGYDVGHIVPGIDDANNFRWETADMNRSRGAKHHR